mgnify:FL=1
MELINQTINQSLNGTLFNSNLLNQTTNITLPVPTWALSSVHGYTENILSGIGINISEFVLLVVGIGFILEGLNVMSIKGFSKIPQLILGIGLVFLSLHNTWVQVFINEAIGNNPYLNYKRADLFLISVGYIFSFRSTASILIALAILSYAIV